MLIAQGDVFFSVLHDAGSLVQRGVARLIVERFEAGAAAAVSASFRIDPVARSFGVTFATTAARIELRLPFACAPRGCVRELEAIYAPVLEELGR